MTKVTNIGQNIKSPQGLLIRNQIRLPDFCHFFREFPTLCALFNAIQPFPHMSKGICYVVGGLCSEFIDSFEDRHNTMPKTKKMCENFMKKLWHSLIIYIFLSTA